MATSPIPRAGGLAEAAPNVATGAGLTSGDLMRAIKQEIKAWEREFQTEFGRKPTKDDVYKDADMLELYKQYSKLKTTCAKLPQSDSTEDTREMPASSLPPDHSIAEPNDRRPSQGAAMGSNDAVGAEAATASSRPTTATAASRMEALRRAQASRKRHNDGGITQSGLTAAGDTGVIGKPALIVTGSVPADQVDENKIDSPAELVSPFQFNDDGVAHPRTMQVVSPEVNLMPPQTHDIRSETASLTDAAGHSEMDASAVFDVEGVKERPKELKDEDLKDVAGAVLATLGVEPPSQLRDIHKQVEKGAVYRASISRNKVQARATTTFVLRSDADNAVVATARREQSLKLKPTYYVFDHAGGTDAAKETAVWKIKGNFEGSLFRITECRSGSLLGLVHYTSSTVPRAMSAVLSTRDEITAKQEETLISTGFGANSASADATLMLFRNKLPKFNDTLKTYCLNFHGRVTMPSVKNFQLAQGDDGPVELQFGRVARDRFNLDVHHPLAPLMGMAIALTTFDAIEKV